MSSMNDIKDVLENSYTGAIMMDDVDAVLRISRALAALDAPIEMDIFTEEFNAFYMRKACNIA